MAELDQLRKQGLRCGMLVQHGLYFYQVNKLGDLVSLSNKELIIKESKSDLWNLTTVYDSQLWNVKLPEGREPFWTEHCGVGPWMLNYGCVFEFSHIQKFMDSAELRDFDVVIFKEGGSCFVKNCYPCLPPGEHISDK